MSHYSDFSLTVLEAAEISQHFGTDVANVLLAGKTFTETHSIAKKHIYGSTRSDWFKWKAGELVAQTPYQDLQFLSEQVCSHLILTNEDEDIIQEHDLINLDEEDEERDYFTSHYYTVIPSDKVGKVLADVNGLLTWCAAHLSIVADVLEWGEDDIQTALDRMQTYERVNECSYGEDGDYPDFFFCALTSIQTMLSYAQTNGLYAIYKNENYDVGLEWFLANKPRMMTFD
ncbi:hypothetical protein DOJK_00172 [Patescibacteria group bacterium]|nr:hypothetical protein DOJK_00172 [Patescibacteria group bacterium]